MQIRVFKLSEKNAARGEAEGQINGRADGHGPAPCGPGEIHPLYLINGVSTERVQWVSLETDQNGNPVKVRTPEEVSTIYSWNDSMTVAGKTYPSFQSFLKEQEGDWGEDLYGRKVLCVKERFPCFDSYDFLYDDRCFRWYFIRKGNSISRVFSADGQNRIYVTEDVQDVDRRVWEKMIETGFCQPPKD